VTHVDFLRVNDTHPVVVTVPVNTFGIPVGVKQQGGVFSVMKKVVRLKTRIGNIPEQFNIDVSELGAGKIFYVRDLKMADVSFLTPPKTALFGVTSGRKEEEPAAAAAKPAAAPAAAKAGEKAGDKAAAPAAKAADKKKK
jgi:large subunit ribosomal protein L25